MIIVFFLLVALIITCTLLAIVSYKLIKSINNMDYYNDGCILANTDNFKFPEDGVSISKVPFGGPRIYLLYSPILSGYLKFDKINFDKVMRNAKKLDAESKANVKKSPK